MPRNNPFIEKFKSVSTGEHHIYRQKEDSGRKLHVFPYDQHPSKKDVADLKLEWLEHQDIKRVTDDYIEKIGEDNFVFHPRLSPEEYDRYLEK